MSKTSAPLARVDAADLAAVDRLLAAESAATLEAVAAAIVDAWEVDGVAVIGRTPDVQVQASAGTLPSLPVDLLADACDRGEVMTRDRTAVLPLRPDRLIAIDSDVDRRTLLAAAQPIIRLAIDKVDATARVTAASELLRRSAAWHGHDQTSLLQQLAECVCDLLDCDRATVFVHHPDRRELVGAPALGVDGGTLRIPDEAGIVGDVFASGRSERIADAARDPRFHKQTDSDLQYETRTLLAAPMHAADGQPVGVVQALNKRRGQFDELDQWTLEQLAVQAAAALARSDEQDRLVRRNASLQAQVAADGVGVDRMVANGPAMTAIRDTVARLAATDLPVLVLGESGSGKEVCAQALHESGPRAEAPFVAVNCAAIAETLLESELFGHERGAFTDAHEARAGKFELAEGGTLFLDEVGDMSPGGQAKLLRVLEQKVVTRVGGSATIPVDVRIVAATNAKLTDRIRDGEFREDLYYRLGVVTIDLPPLRERPDDVLPLAQHFLDGFIAKAGRSLELSDAAARRLQAHAWPGNVRELRNLMERVAFLAPGPTIEPSDLAFMTPIDKAAESGSLPVGLSLSDATSDFQARYIEAVVARTQRNMTDAAAELGLHRSNLYRKMRQLGMEAGN